MQDSNQGSTSMLHFDVINNRTTCVHHSTAKTIAQVLKFNIIRIVYEEIQLRSYIRVPSCRPQMHHRREPTIYLQTTSLKIICISETFGKHILNQLRIISVSFLDPTMARQRVVVIDIYAATSRFEGDVESGV